MTHILDDGTVEIIDVETSATVGYGYAEGNTDPSVRTQRWVLFDGYRAPPIGNVRLQTPADASRKYASLDAWKDALVRGDLWQPGSSYVMSVCSESSTIPQADPEQQFDDGSSTLRRGIEAVAHVYSTLRTGEASYDEHWVLLPEYVQPQRDALVAGAGATAAPTLQDFLDQARGAWESGSTYVVARCTTFTELPAEAEL